MQLNRTMRRVGTTATAAALGLLPAAGVAAARDAESNSSLFGRVVSFGSGHFVVETSHGDSVTVDTTGSTAYTELGNPAALSGVLDGEWVTISLDPSAPAPTATAVTVFPESVGGRVTGVSGSEVTLATRQSGKTVLVTSSTTYVQKDAAPTGVSTGEFVVASGLPDPSSPETLDAQKVFVMTPPAPPSTSSAPGTPRPPEPPEPPDTAGTAPSWPVDHPPVPRGEPLEPSGAEAPASPEPSGPPANGERSVPEPEHSNGQQGTSSPTPQGVPRGAGQGGSDGGDHGWSHGGGDSFGGHAGGGSGGGFGH